MKICCVTRHRFPSGQEIRVTKFGQTLGRAGHEFLVLCPRDRGDASHDELTFGSVKRLGPPSFLNRFGRPFFIPLPINPIWLVWLWVQFRIQVTDVVIIRDLRLALPSILAARLAGARAILDLGEHYPGMMSIIGKQKLHHHLIRNAFLISLLEKICVGLAHCVWVVVEENKVRLNKFAREIVVINNYPVEHASRCGAKCLHRIYDDDADPVNLISLGIIDNIRGLDLAIRALALLVRIAPNVRLTIYGDGPYLSELKSITRDLELEQHVQFAGWVAEQDKYRILASGDIGILLHRVCDLTNHTLPNKLFDYMAVGLPILASKMEPVARVISEEGCGVLSSESPGSVAEDLYRLIMDQGLRIQLGAMGLNASRSRYHWSSEETKILESITLTGNRQKF